MIEREGFFVEPTIVTGLAHDSPLVLSETFAPIVYLLKCSSLQEAIRWNNEAKQGLSSSIFTQDIATLFQVTHKHLETNKLIDDRNIRDIMMNCVVVDRTSGLGLRNSKR